MATIHQNLQALVEDVNEHRAVCGGAFVPDTEDSIMGRVGLWCECGEAYLIGTGNIRAQSTDMGSWRKGFEGDGYCMGVFFSEGWVRAAQVANESGLPCWWKKGYRSPVDGYTGRLKAMRLARL